MAKALTLAAILGIGGARLFGSVPDFGPNVLIFDPAMPPASIQQQVDAVFSRQRRNEFGPARYAFLFKPGAYSVNLDVGFYTQVLGLGQSPDETTVTGSVRIGGSPWHHGALTNFWRSAENLAVVPTGGTDMWAVSQASPMRRMHIRGNLVLSDHGGFSSGGFLSDSVVEGTVDSGTQQQWLTRNSRVGAWKGASWNMVFVGVQNAPAEAFPRPPYVVSGETPIIREKPFLTLDRNEGYSVFVPALRTASRGAGWESGPAPGRSVPISRFYIARENSDTAQTLNSALDRGCNLLFTPGVYSLDQTLRVTHPGTVILGLGLATLLPRNGVAAMEIADIGGVSVAGLLFDAGPTDSPVLLRVGPAGSSLSHSADPTCLSDVYFRVGGAAPGRAACSLEINSNDVIGDNFWIWRADHGQSVGWTKNVASNGLTVNGARVTIYGLAVEHYQHYQTLWNGDHGRVYFYQSEEPYDVPDQAHWMDGPVKGYASYKVAGTVTSHAALGLGIYCFFYVNPAVVLSNAIEAPESRGVRFRDMTTVSLGGGVGEIAAIINGKGAAADRSSILETLARYPLDTASFPDPLR